MTIRVDFARLLTDFPTIASLPKRPIDLWKRGATHANKMARLLAAGLAQIPGLRITRPVEANVVFACIPEAWNERLMAHTYFYVWREDINEVRLMCAWDTQESEVEAFVGLVQQVAR